MPRPKKCRKVCCLPDNDGFVPVRGGEELTPIVLNVDEYEAIRLIDREGFSQEQCGEYMRIARTTVQQIYAAARKKLADALAGVLSALKVDALICGGIGGGALDFNPNVRCDHHDHHGEGHSCGSHGCDHHSCG